MTLARCSLFLFGALVVCIAFSTAPIIGQDPPGKDESWKKHPALAEPDGKSHRGHQMVAADIKDPRVLKELSRRFREAKALRFVEKNGKQVVVGAEDFEKRQEYLLRLLDYYWFSKQQ